MKKDFSIKCKHCQKYLIKHLCYILFVSLYFGVFFFLTVVVNNHFPAGMQSAVQQVISAIFVIMAFGLFLVAGVFVHHILKIFHCDY